MGNTVACLQDLWISPGVTFRIILIHQSLTIIQRHAEPETRLLAIEYIAAFSAAHHFNRGYFIELGAPELIQVCIELGHQESHRGWDIVLAPSFVCLESLNNPLWLSSMSRSSSTSDLHPLTFRSSFSRQNASFRHHDSTPREYFPLRNLSTPNLGAHAQRPRRHTFSRLFSHSGSSDLNRSSVTLFASSSAAGSNWLRRAQSGSLLRSSVQTRSSLGAGTQTNT